MKGTAVPVTPPPSPLQLFLIFTRIGLTSFGGGLSGWLLRAFVQDRRWLTEEEFLNGLSLSQALPGVNVTNMAIWIGFRLFGAWGAFASVMGIVVPPGILIVLLAVGFARVAGYRLTGPLLDGAAAAAIGLSLTMGITAARRVPRQVIPIVTMVLTFGAIALLHLPLPWVVVVGGCASVGLAYLRLARGA
jgi:chromate transporter